MNKKPETEVLELPSKPPIEGQPRLETSLRMWAHDHEISDQALRALIEILERRIHGPWSWSYQHETRGG